MTFNTLIRSLLWTFLPKMALSQRQNAHFNIPQWRCHEGSCSHDHCCLFSAELYWNGLAGDGKQNKIIPHQLYSEEFEAKVFLSRWIRDIPFTILYLKGLASSRERKFTWEKSKRKSISKKISYYHVVTASVSHGIHQIRKF